MAAAFVWGAVGAGALLVGALVAYLLSPSRQVIAVVMALGTGLLIGSVSFELIDEAVKTRTVAAVALLVLVGAATFTAGDWLLDRGGGSERKDPTGEQADGSPLAIVLGSVLDGIPESFVLGLTVLRGGVSLSLLAGGQARLERARSRSFVVDTMVETVRRERPVAVGILAASLAFRLFALLIPLAYVLVAGFGFAAGAAGGAQGTRRSDRLGELVVDSVAAAARGSDRGRWLALAFGGVTTLVAAAGVVEVLRWIHLLAWRMPPARSRPGIWRPLGVVAGLVLVIAAARVADQARVDAKASPASSA